MVVQPKSIIIICYKKWLEFISKGNQFVEARPLITGREYQSGFSRIHFQEPLFWKMCLLFMKIMFDFIFSEKSRAKALLIINLIEGCSEVIPLSPQSLSA